MRCVRHVRKAGVQRSFFCLTLGLNVPILRTKLSMYEKCIVFWEKRLYGGHNEKLLKIILTTHYYKALIETFACQFSLGSELVHFLPPFLLKIACMAVMF